MSIGSTLPEMKQKKRNWKGFTWRSGTTNRNICENSNVSDRRKIVTQGKWIKTEENHCENRMSIHLIDQNIKLYETINYYLSTNILNLNLLKQNRTSPKEVRTWLSYIWGEVYSRSKFKNLSNGNTVHQRTSCSNNASKEHVVQCARPFELTERLPRSTIGKIMPNEFAKALLVLSTRELRLPRAEI